MNDYTNGGDNEAYYLERSSATRIGNRIREIRKARGLTQAQLGEMVGLSPDRIQKYEWGKRKPRVDILKRLSVALQVNTLSMADPTPDKDINTLFTLFELEKYHDLVLEKQGEKIAFSFDDVDFNEYLQCWYNKYLEVQASIDIAESDKEEEQIISDYEKWKWSFSSDNINIDGKQQKRLDILEQIQKLKKELNELK